MTDNEIISGLEHCINRDNPSRCSECEYVTGCKSFLLREALDLINRQKAEIENLRLQIADYKLEAELAWEREVVHDE